MSANNGVSKDSLIGSNNDSSIKFGKLLAHPKPGDEIVISGLSGSYPDSSNVHEFRDNLFNKIDMISSDNRRWEPGHPEVPQSTGKINDIEKFDAGYFGIHHLQANYMDPMVRLFLEKVIEALFDAGINPSDLEGTNTGVFVGVNVSETEEALFYHSKIQGCAITGCTRSMQAQRISYFLKLKGPSFVCDSACSSSMSAFENAYRAIRTGQCDRAIVGGNNLCLHPNMQLQFVRLGVLSMDGQIKVFDNAANGYVRSEASTAILLQKSMEAKRNYSTVLHVKSNCDGYKDNGITYPSSEGQMMLFKEFYEECSCVKASDLSFLEVHGTANLYGPISQNFREKVFLIDVIITTGPMKIPFRVCVPGIPGTSACLDVGKYSSRHSRHREIILNCTTGSHICQGTKVGDPEELHALEKVFLEGRTTSLLIGSLKSNMGHSEPASGLCSITKAIIALETGYIPPNLHYKTPRAGIKALEDGRLKVVTEKIALDDNQALIGINNYGFGGANCHLLLRRNPNIKKNNGVAKDNMPRLVCVSGRSVEAVNILLDDVIENHVDVEQIALLQGIFSKSVLGHHYRGYSILTQSKEIIRSCSTVDEKKRCLVVCFGFTDRGTQRGIKELLTVPLVAEMIQRIQENLSSKNHNISKILLTEENSNILEIILANFTVQMIFAYLLKALGIIPDKIFGLTKGLSLGTLVNTYFDGVVSFEEAVECAYAIAAAANSICIQDDIKEKELINLLQNNPHVTTQLLQELKKVAPKSNNFSKKVIFEEHVSKNLSKYLTNYHGNMKILSNAKMTLKKNFTVFEVGNGFINEFLTDELNNLNENCYVSDREGLNGFLGFLGRMYELGYNPQIQKLYPQVEFPVSRGTPMISPKIKWNHSRKWWVMQYKLADNIEETHSGIMLRYSKYVYMEGRGLHATGYLLLVWETLAHVNGLRCNDMRVVFENCKFKRACSVITDGITINLVVKIVKKTGDFEVIQDNITVVTGKISLLSDDNSYFGSFPVPTKVPQVPSMTTEDIHKELRLRGYNYKDESKVIKSCDVDVQVAEIVWNENWTSFVDNMLQLRIFQEDTRLFYVPTFIQRLTIDAQKHIEYAKDFKKNNYNLPVHVSKHTGLIRSGFVEIRNLEVTSIVKQKDLCKPVLEKHIFVPNVAKLTLEQAVKINMQILIENLYSVKVEIVELINEITSKEFHPLGDLIHKVLEDQPVTQVDIVPCKIGSNINNGKNMLTDRGASLVVGSNISQNKDVLNQALHLIKENGFIMSRESQYFDVTFPMDYEITIITEFTTNQEKLILFKAKQELRTPTVIRVSSKDKKFTWLPILQKAIEKDSSVLVHVQDEQVNGSLGLVNCIRKEPGGENTSILFLPESLAPEFNLNLPFYKKQLKKNMAVNVFKDGQWGTYRYLLLEQGDPSKVEHCFLNTFVRGDLSSLQWMEGPLMYNSPMKSEEVLISVYYATLNFRDALTASGRIHVDDITKVRREQECVHGMEFSGRNQENKRVMGMTVNGACASLVKADRYLLWNVPDDWSLADAATVPVAYGSCIYALYIKGQMRRGNTVLIHSGAGGVGQAAITLALHTGCIVYATVGTPEKREFLKKKFPQLTDDNIANSRDTSFEKHIIKRTNGRGVDIVLNSLADEKLFASIRCLARGGRFLEFGKLDVDSDTQLNLILFKKEASFHIIKLDALFHKDSVAKLELVNILQEGINNGAIKPLEHKVFNMDQSEKAFKHMGSEKHIGKVLIQIRQEEKEKEPIPVQKTFSAIARYYCDASKTYIICGGLGGFGLELADWLVLRGCRKLVLTSRHGVKTGYQAYRISIWKSYGCVVQISTDDISTEKGCQNLIREANKLGPVHAIFNLAVVLKDALLENQTEESFKASFRPKANAIEYLDFVSREKCPELRDFVAFSSVTSGRGLAGQTNYGMSNSTMERICEIRRNEGFPGLTIQWGAVGDVGLLSAKFVVYDTLEIEGTRPQRITSCLECLDSLLRQNESAVVSSLVLGQKKVTAVESLNIVDAIAAVLGIKDLKTISLQATLAQLGMDSMSILEVKQTMERDFQLFLTAQEIKSMTFEKLKEIQEQQCSGNWADNKSDDASSTNISGLSKQDE